MKYYTADEEHVKFLGRAFYENGLLWCTYSGTGAAFTFYGTKLQITTVGDSVSEQPDNQDNFARIGIYVNGTRLIDSLQDQKEKIFQVWESSVPKEVTVEIIKLSETAMSSVALKQIGVNAEQGIQPLAEKRPFIEFIGDSITCGYGVDDEDKEHHFSTSTEDVTRAFAYRTAEKLQADYSMVSISGYGIISGYSGDGETKIGEQTLPEYYEKAGFSYGSFHGSFPQDYVWDFQKRQPDLIVINLGTNDDSYCNIHTDRQEEFYAHYILFLKQVRKKNPPCPILCVLGMMGDRLYPFVERAVSDYKKETGESNIYALRLEPQREEDGYVADWHPTSVTHEKASIKLTEEIKKIL